MRDGTFSVNGAAVGPAIGLRVGRTIRHTGPSVRWQGSDDRVATLSGVRRDPGALVGEGASFGRRASRLSARMER